jgi:hypothetical protein
MYKYKNTNTLLYPPTPVMNNSNNNVREYEGWVRNVALIKCTLGPGKTQGGLEFGREGTGSRLGNKGSYFTSNLGLRWTIPVTARRVPSK